MGYESYARYEGIIGSDASELAEVFDIESRFNREARRLFVGSHVTHSEVESLDKDDDDPDDNRGGGLAYLNPPSPSGSGGQGKDLPSGDYSDPRNIPEFAYQTGL